MTVTPAHLAIYLGVDLAALDEQRADYLIALAVQACERVVSPLPDGVDDVVLEVAGAAYVTPPGPGGTQTAGPYSAPVAAGGLRLSKRQRMELRRSAGRGGGAFTVTPGPGHPPLPYGWNEADPALRLGIIT